MVFLTSDMYRNYRDRKENYIKALEQELFRLEGNRRSFLLSQQILVEENQTLKSLLAQYGIPFLNTRCATQVTHPESNQCSSTRSTPNSYAACSQEISEEPQSPHTYISPPGIDGYGLALVQHSPQLGSDFGQDEFDPVSMKPDPWAAYMAPFPQSRRCWSSQ